MDICKECLCSICKNSTDDTCSCCPVCQEAYEREGEAGGNHRRNCASFEIIDDSIYDLLFED